MHWPTKYKVYVLDACDNVLVYMCMHETVHIGFHKKKHIAQTKNSTKHMSTHWRSHRKGKNYNGNNVGRASVGGLQHLPERPAIRTDAPIWPSRVAQNKKSPSLSSQIVTAPAFILQPTLESPTCPHRRGVLYRDHATRGRTQQHVAPHPSAVVYLPISPPPFATHRRVLRANAAWSTAFFTTSAACMPPSSLSIAPERCLLATAVPHQVGRGRATPC
jgi:hypothetical protein